MPKTGTLTALPESVTTVARTSLAWSHDGSIQLPGMMTLGGQWPCSAPKLAMLGLSRRPGPSRVAASIATGSPGGGARSDKAGRVDSRTVRLNGMELVLLVPSVEVTNTEATSRPIVIQDPTGSATTSTPVRREVRPL